MKRILSLALAVVMLVGCLAVLSACTQPTPNPGPQGPTDPVWDPNAEYTYNTYTSTFPTKWNPHTYETANDSVILDYTTVGFYTFDYNANKDGFVIVPEMAKEMPIDVTADYVGEKWGIEDDETSRAWKIVLRDDLRWEDGTPIVAADFIRSSELLLDPQANNHRADSMYEGDLKIYNAKSYFYQGQSSIDDNGITAKYVFDDLVKGEDGVYTQPNGQAIWITIGGALDWLGGNSLADYVGAYPTFFDAEAWAALVALADADGNVALTDESYALLVSVITYDYDNWGETEEDAMNYWMYEVSYGEMSFDQVGMIALSDTELVIILEDPLKGFQLNYNLTGNFSLVHEAKYTACMEWNDGVLNSTYGTTVDTYMSFGPYKLTTFIRDKQIVVEKNDQWYGYSDPAYADTYWTTRVVIDWIDNPQTAMEAFLKGELDSKGLDVDQIKDYANSKHTYYTDGASTFFVAMNPDAEAFTKWEAENPGKDKHIMTVKEFRMALSFSLDRKAFNLACDPTGNTAFAVFNDMICSDPDNGTMYRTTEYAKDAILKFWGISQDDIGPGKLYSDKDDAIDSITGYNLDAAKKLFDQAYDYAIANGLMSETDVVEICIGLPSATSKFYTNGFTFLSQCWTDAVKGTKLEGKLTFTKDDTIGNQFADKLEINQVNLLFGVGWQGSSLNPYGLMMAYTTPRYQYDVSAWDTSVATMDFEIDGVTYRATVEAWTYAMSGQKTNLKVVGEDGEVTSETLSGYSCGVNDDKPDERLRLFAALEGAILEQYNLLPLNNESSAALKGMQIKYGTEEYVYGVGRGGIKYMKYWYTDAQWDAFVASQNGELNYK